MAIITGQGGQGSIRSGNTLDFVFPQRFLGLYFPAASAGTPPISPTYDPFWNDTSSAVRVVSRLNKKYGTALENVSLALGTRYNNVLIRQYVCPLQGSGIQPYSFLPAYLPFDQLDITLTGMGLFGKLGANVITRTVSAINYRFYTTLWAIVYLVNAAGTRINTTPTQTATVTHTQLTSGSFAAGDVDKSFVIQAKPNLCNIVNVGAYNEVAGSPNSVSSFVSASVVNVAGLYYPDTGTGPDYGSRTIEGMFLYEPHNRSAHALGAFGTTTQALAANFLNTQTTGFAVSRGSLTTKNQREDYYIVIEIGVTNADAISQTVTLEFGDPTDNLSCATSTHGDSAGATVQYAVAPSMILR